MEEKNIQDIIKDIGTSYWWVSVVIVGVLINIVSSFIFKYYEKIGAKWSNEKKKKLEAEAKLRVDIIKKLVDDKTFETKYLFEIINSKINSMRYLILGLICFSAPIDLMEYFVASNHVWYQVYTIIYALISIVGVMSIFLAYRIFRNALKQESIYLESQSKQL